MDKKLLDYFNEFFESIQKNDVTGKVFKKKKRNIEKMFNYIKDLNNIVKERDLKKEKEKEEKKETKKYIINENIMPQIDDLIDESSDILLNMYRSMSENIIIEIDPIQLEEKENTDCDSKKKNKNTSESTDKNEIGKIKTRIIKDLKEEFNNKAKTMGFLKGKQKNKTKLKTIKIINKNNHEEDLKYLKLKFRDIIFENEKIDFSKEGKEVQDLLDTKIGDHFLKIMNDEDKKKKFINTEKDNNIKHQKTEECRKIIYEIMETKNLDGLILLLMTETFMIAEKDEKKYIKFPASTKEFEALIKNLKQYKDLNLDLIIDEYKIDRSVQNFLRISNNFSNEYLEIIKQRIK